MNESFEMFSPYCQKTRWFWIFPSLSKKGREKTSWCCVRFAFQKRIKWCVDRVKENEKAGNWFQDGSFERGAKTIASHMHTLARLPLLWLWFWSFNSYTLSIGMIHHQISRRIRLLTRKFPKRKNFFFHKNRYFDCPHAKSLNNFYWFENVCI